MRPRWGLSSFETPRSLSSGAPSRDPLAAPQSLTQNAANETGLRNRHCERSEAIQGQELDCFVASLLAMTEEERPNSVGCFSGQALRMRLPDRRVGKAPACPPFRITNEEIVGTAQERLCPPYARCAAASACGV